MRSYLTNQKSLGLLFSNKMGKIKIQLYKQTSLPVQMVRGAERKKTPGRLLASLRPYVLMRVIVRYITILSLTEPVCVRRVAATPAEDSRGSGLTRLLRPPCAGSWCPVWARRAAWCAQTPRVWWPLRRCRPDSRSCPSWSPCSGQSASHRPLSSIW